MISASLLQKKNEIELVDMQSRKCGVCVYLLHKSLKICQSTVYRPSQVNKDDVSHNSHVLFVCDVYVFPWTSSGDGVNLWTETINNKL